MYGFSRDGAIPGFKFLHKVDHRWRSQTRTGSSFHRDFALPNRERWGLLFAFVLVRLACALRFVLGLPSLGSSVAFPAYTVRSSPLSALYFLRYAIRLPKSPSPFHEISHHINSHQPPRHLCGSNCRGTICLPELNPVNSQTPNYAPVAVGLVLTYTLGFWAISARRWFAESIKRIAGEEKLN
jgi:hypothetical protein